MAVRAVFFDFVGTLADVVPDVGTVYAETARPFGLDLDPAVVGRAFAKVFPRRRPLAFPPDRTEAERRTAELAWWQAVVADTLRACGLPLHRRPDGTWAPDGFAFEAYFAALWEVFATPSVWRLDPSARPVLESLRSKGFRTGIVSNFDGRLPVLLKRLGLGSLLDVVVYSSKAGAAKPEAPIFWEACRQVGLPPDEALHVGDDPKLDYWGARRAGLQARWREDDASLPDSDVPEADRIHSLTDLMYLLPL